jgi:hypothetical protein
MDRHFDDQGFNDSGLKTRPSDLFRRNCWISFEPVEGSLKVLAEYIGANKILWATDCPHHDSFFPGAPQMIRDRLAGASPEVQHQVMAGGAMAFYGLNCPLPGASLTHQARSLSSGRAPRGPVGAWSLNPAALKGAESRHPDRGPTSAAVRHREGPLAIALVGRFRCLLRAFPCWFREG